MKRLLLFVLIIMGFCGRFASDAKRCPVAQAVVEPVEPLLVRPVQDDMQCRLWVDSVLDRLSLKERVGQLFIYTIAPHQEVDPDNGLVYVFLSNRIYPNVWNSKLLKLDIRGKIQEAMYQAVLK